MVGAPFRALAYTAIMTPTKLLVGQILVALAIVIAAIRFTTGWCASEPGLQVQLGTSWFILLGLPFHRPWELFAWWFWYNAYALATFSKADAILVLRPY